MKIEVMLLTLIRLRPDVTGYQLAAIIEAAIGRVAGVHLSKIYPALKRLTEQGYLVFRAVPSKGRPDQKYYTITPEGEEAFQRMIRRPFKFKPSRGSFDDFMLKLACMATVGKEVALAHIDLGIAHLSEIVASGDSCTDNESVASFMDSPNISEDAPTIELWDTIRSQILGENEKRLEWLKGLRKKYEDD